MYVHKNNNLVNRFGNISGPSGGHRRGQPSVAYIMAEATSLQIGTKLNGVIDEEMCLHTYIPMFKHTGVAVKSW